MSYTYTEYVSTLANTLVVPEDDVYFVAELPRIIDDAEQRCYRDLDLLTTIVRDSSGSLTANSRNFTFPRHFVVSESINVLTPDRYQLIPTTREFLDAVYPNETAVLSPSVPQYYAMITDQTIIVGPPPDTSYALEVIGTIRPDPLSAANTTTYLTLYLPDLFFAASCMFAFSYLQNYGAAADSPQSTGSWDSHYAKLLASADVEENRKKYASQAWTPKQPAPLATPPRA